MIKAWIRGEQLPRPLIMPVLFSLGARLENLPLRDFQSNPTKISNALRQIRSVLKVDGLTCYFDPFLEAEALGCKREWRAGGSCNLAPTAFSSADDLRQSLKPPDSLAGQGPIPVACEVVKRLKVMLKDEPALMARVTGPFTLAAQLLGKTEENTEVPQDVVEFAAEATAAVTKAFLEAGADVILFAESFWPANAPELQASYASLLAPIFNVIRFFEAMPVLLGPAELASNDEILSLASDCVLCQPLSGSRPPQTSGFGVVLPAAAFAEEDKDWEASLRVLAGSQQPVLITSTGDIPASTDLKVVADSLGRLRILTHPKQH